MKLQEIYDYMVENSIVSEDALELITSINGFNEDTLNDVLYNKTAYRDIEQYLESEDRETYDEYYDDDED